MSANIYAKGNTELSAHLFDDTPLSDFTRDFMDMAGRHFDGSVVGIYDGDFEVPHDRLKGLSKITELLDFCLENWQDFYSNNRWGVKPEEVSEFNSSVKQIIAWCREHRVPLIHTAD